MSAAVVWHAGAQEQRRHAALYLIAPPFRTAGSLKTGCDTVRYAMGATDKVVGTGMLSFITLSREADDVQPPPSKADEAAEELPGDGSAAKQAPTAGRALAETQ